MISVYYDIVIIIFGVFLMKYSLRKFRKYFLMSMINLSIELNLICKIFVIFSSGYNVKYCKYVVFLQIYNEYLKYSFDLNIIY